MFLYKIGATFGDAKSLLFVAKFFGFFLGCSLVAGTVLGLVRVYITG